MYEQANTVNRANSSLGSLRGVSADTDRVMLLDDITRRVQGSNERLSDLVCAVRDMADSLFGGVPTTGATGRESGDKIGGRAYGLVASTGTTDDLIAQLREQVDRLRAL